MRKVTLIHCFKERTPADTFFGATRVHGQNHPLADLEADVYRRYAPAGESRSGRGVGLQAPFAVVDCIATQVLGYLMGYRGG